MLEVLTVQEARNLILARFSREATECVPRETSCGRVLARDLISEEGVPPFTRSTVDGYAVRAADTFGCSEALPSLVECTGAVTMGKTPVGSVTPGTCQEIPTGGMLPEGADAVVMVEHSESYGDGTVGILKPVSPGDNLIFAHDDVAPGAVLVEKGCIIQPHHIGTFASLGLQEIEVSQKLKVSILSTGDELVDADTQPQEAQIRDVNAPMLAACAQSFGAEPVRYGIIEDQLDALDAAMARAQEECDMVLVSGGSSVGARDNTARILSSRGELLFHGIALKPGKPTLCADMAGVPVFGLPGHPVATYFVFLELVRPLIGKLLNLKPMPLPTWRARLSQAIPSNHGRAEIVPVRLHADDEGLIAEPVRNKSGLISLLSQTDGYVMVDRDQEGISAGSAITVRPYTGI